MIYHVLHSWKTVPVVFAAFCLTIVALATDSSPIVPWLLGALIPLSGGILALLWKIQGRLTILETQVTPLWSSLQKEVADALHHPHPESQEMDKLLEKLEALVITAEERSQLEKLLHRISRDTLQSEGERRRAELLLFLMPRVVRESQCSGLRKAQAKSE